MAGVDGLVDQAIQLAQVSGMSFSEALTGLRAATDLSEASVERARAVNAEAQRDLAWEAKARVRALHSPDDGGPAWCAACEVKYPCQTIRALDGPRP